MSDFEMMYLLLTYSMFVLALLEYTDKHNRN